MKTKTFIIFSLMAFIFISCDKDDEKVLPEEQEQEQEQKQDEEKEKEEVEEQHNGAFIFKCKVLNSEGINYFNIDHSNLKPGYAWFSPEHFYARCSIQSPKNNHFYTRLDMNSYAKIDDNTIISGDERYVLADEEGRNFTTWATGDWMNTVDYMMNQDRDKDTTNVWCGLTYCENNGDPYFVFGMLNPDSLVGKCITLEIYDTDRPILSGAIDGFAFERFTYKPHSNNLDSVYVSKFTQSTFKYRSIYGYAMPAMFNITFDVKDTTEQWYYTKQRMKPNL